MHHAIAAFAFPSFSEGYRMGIARSCISVMAQLHADSTRHYCDGHRKSTIQCERMAGGRRSGESIEQAHVRNREVYDLSRTRISLQVRKCTYMSLANSDSMVFPAPVWLFRMNFSRIYRLHQRV